MRLYTRKIYRNSAIFAAVSNFFPLRNSRGSFTIPAMDARIPRKYELLNLDKGSRLGEVLARTYVPCNKATECRRTPCNQMQSRRLLIYTSRLVKAEASQWGPVCKNHKHRVRCPARRSLKLADGGITRFTRVVCCCEHTSLLKRTNTFARALSNAS